MADPLATGAANEMPLPTLQPKSPTEPFGTDEILWWNNGIWGQAGYAIPNPGGKTWTNNPTMLSIVDFMGSELFGLMHREDVKFTRPPNKQWLYDFYKMASLGVKRLTDRAIDFNQDRTDGVHATPAPQVFPVYPVPYFGERIRQPDIREYCTLILLAISEVMQDSDNEFTLDVSKLFATRISRYIVRSIKLMATKYLGYSRADVDKPDFNPLGIPDVKFSSDPAQGYNPASLFTSTELVEERPPLRWWPTENDLSALRKIPITTALAYARRWPDSDVLLGGDGGAVSAFPGTGTPREQAPAVAQPGSSLPGTTGLTTDSLRSPGQAPA